MKILMLLLPMLGFAGDFPLANYEVPVPAELKEYAHFYLSDLQVDSRRDGRIKITYTLPLVITGVKNRIRFEGTVGEDGVARLTGEHNSTMECRAEGEGQKCVAKYHGIEQDLEAVASLLDTLKVPAEEKEMRLAVARHAVKFPTRALAAMMREGGDMEGFIFYGSHYGRLFK
jgi:hypothetical protein